MQRQPTSPGDDGGENDIENNQEIQSYLHGALSPSSGPIAARRQNIPARASEERLAWTPPVPGDLSVRMQQQQQQQPVTSFGRSRGGHTTTTSTSTSTPPTQHSGRRGESKMRDFRSDNSDNHGEETSLRKLPPTATSPTTEKVKSLPFPYKLYHLLEDLSSSSSSSSSPDDMNIAEIFSWTPDGKAFCIHDKTAFCSVIMPRYFRQSKFQSFTRQLYIYGFSKVESKSTFTFAHPQFVRGEKDSVAQIGRNQSGVDRRKRRKEMAKRRSSDTPSDGSLSGSAERDGAGEDPSLSSISQRQVQQTATDVSSLEQLNLFSLQQQQDLDPFNSAGAYSRAAAMDRSASAVSTMGSSDHWKASMGGGSGVAGVDHHQSWLVQQQPPQHHLSQQQIQQQLQIQNISAGPSFYPPNDFNPTTGFGLGPSVPHAMGLYQQQAAPNVSGTVGSGMDGRGDNRIDIHPNWDLEPRPIEDMIAASRKWNEKKKKKKSKSDHPKN